MQLKSIRRSFAKPQPTSFLSPESFAHPQLGLFSFFSGLSRLCLSYKKNNSTIYKANRLRIIIAHADTLKNQSSSGRPIKPTGFFYGSISRRRFFLFSARSLEIRHFVAGHLRERGSEKCEMSRIEPS